MPDGGVNLVIAGAGTGKTSTLIQKVLNIIDDGKFRPENILILTFNRRAAEEIKHRISLYIANDIEYITSATFHSFSYSLLQQNREFFIKNFNFSGFPTILDEDEKKSIHYDLIENSLDRFLGFPASVIYSLMDCIDRLDRPILKKLKRHGIIEGINDFRERYSDYKRSKGLIDFNDIINYTIELLEKNEDIRERTIQRYQYILVDEFQDTSESNFRLLKLLIKYDNPNIFLVGDDWQSIYSFRGARVEYIVKMKKFFPDVNIIKLRINYRSRKDIVSISNKLIKINRFKTKKRLKSFKGKGGGVYDYPVNGFMEELEKIKDILLNRVGSSTDLAILYRNNWQGDYIVRNIQDIELIKSDRPQLMTIHSSKGLEFDTVIIAGVSDDIIPDALSDIEEERRLFYVALTRAKENLHIIHHLSDKGEGAKFAKEMGFL